MTHRKKSHVVVSTNVHKWIESSQWLKHCTLRGLNTLIWNDVCGLSYCILQLMLLWYPIALFTSFMTFFRSLLCGFSPFFPLRKRLLTLPLVLARRLWYRTPTSLKRSPPVAINCFEIPIACCKKKWQVVTQLIIPVDIVIWDHVVPRCDDWVKKTGTVYTIITMGIQTNIHSWAVNHQ